MIILNSCFFIDIESCLIKTKSGKAFPIHLADWKFNDEVLNHIKTSDYSKVCLLADRELSLIPNIIRYERFLDFVKEQLFKIVKKEIQVIFYKTKDEYFNYPHPGGLLTFVIDNDINLSASVYVTNNPKAFNYSGIRKGYSISKFILNG